MHIQEIIAKKRDKKQLSKEEIEFFVKGYTADKITDYQAAALVMAIYINGMTTEEITNLTLAMAYSGDVLDLLELGKVVDKHSTGGIGDKVTLVLMPIVAALGVKVAKMSGRGLGYTGGTADKLESIPGYQIIQSEEKFKKQVQEIGISLITQTANLAPADKKLYALRDVIACTDSIPLISSSIMSKKIAAGANKIVLEVTCGNGAFMRTKEDAIALANCMKEIGELAGKQVVSVITNMEEPLGYSIGNQLEIIEATNALKTGVMAEDIKQTVNILGAYMLKLAGKGEDIQENIQKIEECIASGKAYEKWMELVEAQGGDIGYLQNTSQFKKAKYEIPVVAEKAGYITKIQARNIGEIAGKLGAGREKKEDNIDFTAGVVFNKKVGDMVDKEEIIATLYTNKEEEILQAKTLLEQAIQIGESPVPKEDSILAVIE